MEGSMAKQASQSAEQFPKARTTATATKSVSPPVLATICAVRLSPLISAYGHSNISRVSSRSAMRSFGMRPSDTSYRAAASSSRDTPLVSCAVHLTEVLLQGAELYNIGTCQSNKVFLLRASARATKIRRSYCHGNPSRVCLFWSTTVW